MIIKNVFKKLLFLCLCAASSITFCMKKNPIKIAFFFQKDPAVQLQWDRHIAICEEERIALEEDRLGAIAYPLACAIYQRIDIIYVTSALMRVLFYVEKTKRGPIRSWLRDYFKEIKKNFDIYKNKNGKIAVFVLKSSKKKLERFLSIKSLDEESDYLKPVKYNSNEVLFQHFWKRHYNESFIDELIYLLPDNSCVDSIIYLGGHGTDEGEIANLTIQEYIRFINKLNDIDCLFLYVYSCYSGGENDIKVHSQLKKSNFPIVHRAFTDCGYATMEPDFEGYYKNMSSFFKQNKKFDKSCLHNVLVKKALSCINGLNGKILNKDINKNINIKTFILKESVFFLCDVSACCFGLFKNSFLHGMITFEIALLLMTYTIISWKNSAKRRHDAKRHCIVFNKKNLGFVLSAFLPYSKDEKNFLSQEFFILDNTILVIDVSLLLKNALKGVSRTSQEINVENPQKIEVKEIPIVVKDKDFLLIKLMVIDGTVKIEGVMPVCFSAIQGPACHYIEKIEAKHVPFKVLCCCFLPKKIFPKKLFVIGKIICKNFDGSGILHPEDKNRDNKKEDLIITNCFIYKPEGAIRDGSKAICTFGIKRNDRVVFIKFSDDFKKAKEIDEREYLQSPFVVDSNVLDMSNNSKSIAEKFAYKIDKIFRNAEDEVDKGENIVVNDQQEKSLDKQEKTQSFLRRHKRKFVTFAGVSALCIIAAGGFLLRG